MNNSLRKCINKYGKFATTITLFEIISVLIYFLVCFLNLFNTENDFDGVFVFLKLLLIPVIFFSNIILGIITIIKIIIGIAKKEEQYQIIGNAICFIIQLLANISILIIFIFLHGYWVAMHGGV